MYLQAAAQTLPGDPAHGAFHYTKPVRAGDVAMLEFETTAGANTSMAVTSSATMTPGTSWSFG
jgi:hypothetical protein